MGNFITRGLRPAGCTGGAGSASMLGAMAGSGANAADQAAALVETAGWQKHGCSSV
jgi:hypothetical protein